MKHSIRLTLSDGSHAYLSHRGKTTFAPATARKYLAQWLAANPGGAARIEDQFRDPIPARVKVLWANRKGLLERRTAFQVGTEPPQATRRLAVECSR